MATKIQVKEVSPAKEEVVEKKSEKRQKVKGGFAQKIKHKFSLDGLKPHTLVKATLCLLLFAVPLFFGMGMAGNIALAKQTLLLFLVLAGLGLWFVQSLSDGECKIQLSWLHLATIIFLVSTLISTLVSVWKWGSFWGWPQQSRENLLTFLLLALFYFLVSHTSEEPVVKKLFTALLASGAIAALIGILQLFEKFVLPFDFTRVQSFNPLGAMGSWGIFLAALVPIALPFATFAKKKSAKILSYMLVLLFTGGVLLVNNRMGWLTMLFGTGALVVIILWKSRQKTYQSLILPAFLFSLSFCFAFLSINPPGLPSTPATVTPTLRSTFEVAIEMLKGSAKTWLVGWGPGTFKYGWSKFRSQDLNQTIFWNTRFTRGGSEVIERIGTLGILGTLSFVALIGISLWTALKTLAGKGVGTKWILHAGIFSSFLALTINKFFTTHNIALDFLWWFLLAEIAIYSMPEIKSFKLEPDSKANFIFSFLGIIILTGSILCFYLGGSRYWAEIKYRRALTKQNIDEMLVEIGGAINFNPNQETFWRDLSQLYTLKAQQELNRDTSAEEKQSNTSNFIANAVATSREATAINPENVANWEIRASTYQQILGASEGAFEWSVSSYEKALALEPNNPYLLVELSRVYLTRALMTEEGDQRNNYLSQAEEKVRTAFELKPDYAQASYQMAAIYEAQGKTQDAIDMLENLKSLAGFIVGYNPMQDVGLALQLGVLYYNTGDLDTAEKEFERALVLNPDYSNAKYLLGLVYSRSGDTVKALEKFEEVAELNPENEEIQQIITNLMQGKEALAHLQEQEVPEGLPEELPIEEKPEEK